MPAALAPLISDGPILVLLLIVLAQLPEKGLSFIQTAGGLFILYLAWGAFRADSTDTSIQTPAVDKRSGLTGALQGAAMNALNPAPYIFWGTVGGPLLLNGWRISPWIGASFLIGFYGCMIPFFGILIWLFGRVGELSASARRMMNRFSGAALLLFGLSQLFLGIRAIAGR